MRQRKRQPAPDEEAGAPEWMVTFSDCMTLLLTFFVLLLSFSSFDEHFFQRLRLILARELHSVHMTESKSKKNAFLPTRIIQFTEEVDKGSEKPTLVRNRKENLKQETESEDIRNRKVFIISSDEVFWGKGTVISLTGRKTLSTIASFLKEVPNLIVISESAPVPTAKGQLLGLRRSWAVIKYFTSKPGLDKNKFSISAGSTTAKESQVTRNKRMLEIVLLERSIYN